MRRRTAAAAAAAAAAAGAVLLLAACTSSKPTSPPATSAHSAATSSPAQTTPTPPDPAPLPDWPTYHGDLARTGVSTTMPAATGPPRLRSSLKLDGQVYASPIVAGGRTIVATENDTVYAFDDAGKQIWRKHLGSPSPADERACGNIDPLGITGTPTFDRASGLVFVAAQYGGPPRHELVALAVADGAVRWRKSLDLPGVETAAMQERGALTVTGGRVWVPFGGLAGDCGGYKGRVIGMAVDGSGAPVAYTVPTTREAGIWTPPGPSVDARGHLFVSVGNGESGQGDRYDHSDSVLDLDANARLVDSYSPRTWATDNEGDLDLGSQGPALVGPWVFIAGKSGTAYVLRQRALGGIGGEISQAEVCRSFGGTAVVGDVVYVPCTDGVRAVRIDSRGRIHTLWHAGESVTGSPVVGGGRVWTLDTDAGVLHALDPRTGRSLARVGVGSVTRFATPALYGNRVLIPTQAGLAVVTTS
jgi:outer membrane protein assembly factor BamB